MAFEQYFSYETTGFGDQISAIRGPRIAGLNDPKFAEFQAALKKLPDVETDHITLNKSVVEIGLAEELDEGQHAQLLEALQAFIPWKKGPFKLFGNLVDAEWRSDMKWARIEPNITPLKGKVVADIGCNNGYFMYRMVPHDPKLVIGFEPYAKHLFCFALLQHFARCPQLQFDLLGVEHFHLYPKYFDTIFCLGILYHHTDPVGLLRGMFAALKPGGELIVECQGILGEESVALVPSGRYAQARGIWNLPTPLCLENWLTRSGFKDVEVFSSQLLSTAEQRTTPWAPIKSLKDFLDPENPGLTVEGYPAPARIYVRAQR